VAAPPTKEDAANEAETNNLTRDEGVFGFISGYLLVEIGSSKAECPARRTPGGRHKSERRAARWKRVLLGNLRVLKELTKRPVILNAAGQSV
jgi:hypothetical protein